MAWKALSDLKGNVRRTWERRRASGAALSYVDPSTSQVMVWVGWPGRAPLKATG